VTVWTLPEGRRLIQRLERHLRPHYFSALAGSVLYRGRSAKDLDVVILPMHAGRCVLAEIYTGLTAAGLEQRVSAARVQRHWRSKGITDTKHVEVWHPCSGVYEGRRIDIILPAPFTDPARAALVDRWLRERAPVSK
jgi:hypothetical protein